MLRICSIQARSSPRSCRPLKHPSSSHGCFEEARFQAAGHPQEAHHQPGPCPGSVPGGPRGARGRGGRAGRPPGGRRRGGPRAAPRGGGGGGQRGRGREEGRKPRKDAKPAKARRLSKQALQDHNLFLKEAKDLSEEDFDHFFKKLNEKQKQCLWKKFETSRQANPGAEPAFKDGTGTGSGQVARKRGMLRGWVFDGGKPAKFFKQSSVEFSCTRSSGLQASWLSYKETCAKIGEEELKARVAAGTIQHRKNPEDRRFFQFKLHKAWCCAKFITADSGESCRFTLSGNRRHHHLPQNWLQGPGQSGRHPPGHRFLRQPQGGTLR